MAPVGKLPARHFEIQRRSAAGLRGALQQRCGIVGAALVEQQAGHVDQHRGAAAGAVGGLQHGGGVLLVADAAAQAAPADQQSGIGDVRVVQRAVDRVGAGQVAGGFAGAGGIQGGCIGHLAGP